MNLPEIDSALAEWNNRLAAIAKNLLDLQADSTYQLLTGSGGVAKLQLTGSTASRVEPPLGAMLTIFQHFGLLHETIERAIQLRASLPVLFGGEAKTVEIRRLLRERSIRLPDLNVPLEQKTLLSGVQRADCFSPDELLGLMSNTFLAARDVVLTVDLAWKQLASATDLAEAQLSRLGAQPELIGHYAAAELNNAARLLQQLRAQVTLDPLGARADLETRLQPVLAKLAKLAEAAEALQGQIGDGRAQLEVFSAVHREAEAAYAEAHTKIVGATRLPLPAAGEKGNELRTWLDRLEKKYSEGLLDAVTVGLRNWQAALESCIAQERATSAAHCALLEARAELRGRLDALRAKARAYGIAEESSVAGASEKAEALLYARPTDLDLAAAAVRDYEQRVNGAGRRGRTTGGGPR